MFFLVDYLTGQKHSRGAERLFDLFCRKARTGCNEGRGAGARHREGSSGGRCRKLGNQRETRNIGLPRGQL